MWMWARVCPLPCPPPRSYFDKIAAISAPGYVASMEDLLKSRVRTSGIVEEAYRIDGVDFVCVPSSPLLCLPVCACLCLSLAGYRRACVPAQG